MESLVLNDWSGNYPITRNFVSVIIIDAVWIAYFNSFYRLIRWDVIITNDCPVLLSDRVVHNRKEEIFTAKVIKAKRMRWLLVDLVQVPARKYSERALRILVNIGLKVC